MIKYVKLCHFGNMIECYTNISLFWYNGHNTYYNGGDEMLNKYDFISTHKFDSINHFKL